MKSRFSLWSVPVKMPMRRDHYYIICESFRQKHKQIVWLLTGSIGLDVVSRDLALAGALIDLNTFPLEPFTLEAAHSFVEELCNDKQLRQPLDFETGAFELLARELGWLSPYYLRHIAQLIRPSTAAVANKRAVASQTDVERAFAEFLKPAYRGHFAAWEEHIDKNFAEGQRARLRAILDILCENIDGEIEATLLARISGSIANLLRRELLNLLTILANDGFIEKFSERWRFRSGLLRRYWVEYMKA
jgi:uncharacterized protein